MSGIVSISKLEEAKDILAEVYGFVSSGPRAQEGINAALGLIDQYMLDQYMTQPQPVAQGEAVAWLIEDHSDGVSAWLPVVYMSEWLARDRMTRHDCFRASITPLYKATPATPTIPTGHRVVPVDEVAWQMLDAGMAAWKESATHEVPHQSGTAVVKSDTRHRLKVAFKAMLAAAPDAGGV